MRKKIRKKFVENDVMMNEFSISDRVSKVHRVDADGCLRIDSSVI